MSKGTVKWFNPTKGYGFIQPQGGGGRDVFVHISAVERGGLSSLSEGQVVEYEEVLNRGKASAENLLGVVAKLGFKAHPHMFRHACGFQLADQGTTRAPCRRLSAIATSSTPCATPNCRPRASRTSGATDADCPICQESL